MSSYLSDMRKVLVLAVLLAWAPSTAADVDLDLGQYQGQVVIVDFWASWCVPCRRSFPWMNTMQAKYADKGLVILAVNLDQNSDDAAAFLAKYPANFTVIYDPDADFAQKYGVEVMPSSFVVGKDGSIADKHTGFKVRKQGAYEAVIRSALDLEIQ